MTINFPKKLIAILLCICILLMPLMIPLQAHALSELVGLAGLTSEEIGALITMLSAKIGFTSAAAAEAAAAEVAASTALVPVGETALVAVAEEAAVASTALTPLAWVAIAAIGTAALTQTIVAVASLWSEQAKDNPVAANTVEYLQNVAHIDFVPMVSDDYIDPAACVSIPGYFEDPYGDWNYNYRSWGDLFDYFCVNLEPIKAFEIEFATSKKAGITNPLVSGYFFDSNANLRRNTSDGSLNEDSYYEPEVKFGLVYKWSDSNGEHTFAPMNFGISPWYDRWGEAPWNAQKNLSGSSLLSFDVRVLGDYFAQDPLGSLGFNEYTILYPYVNGGQVSLNLVNPTEDFSYEFPLGDPNAFGDNVHPLNTLKLLSSDANEVSALAYNSDILLNPPVNDIKIEGMDITDIQDVGNTYVPIPSSIGHKNVEEIIDWYKENNPDLEPIPLADVQEYPNNTFIIDPAIEEIEELPNSDRRWLENIKDLLPDIPTRSDIITNNEGDTNHNWNFNFDLNVDLSPVTRLLEAIKEDVAAIKNWLLNLVTDSPEDLEERDLTDLFRDVGQLLSGYTLFQGLFSHFLPAEVATMLWAFFLCGICIAIIKFLIDR